MSNGVKVFCYNLKMESEVSLTECFELQLSEVEMLNSMYPNSGEFVVSLPHVLADMNKFISGESKYIPNQLDFSLNLTIPDLKDTLDVNVCLPHKYPFVNPEISIRSVGLDRSQQKELNTALRDFLQSLPSGDICVLSLLNWLTENADEFFSTNCQTNEGKTVKKPDSTPDILCRMWIYSHHIYNKFKRRKIIDMAENLKLTGFSLPGKPGFICIEGCKRDCSNFLQQLKLMNWKKISLVREETEDSEEVDMNQFRKFENFCEVSFEVRKGPAREYHMDMGQFLKYLGEHSCTYAFQDLFGFEGQVPSEK